MYVKIKLQIKIREQYVLFHTIFRENLLFMWF